MFIVSIAFFIYCSLRKHCDLSLGILELQFSKLFVFFLYTPILRFGHLVMHTCPTSTHVNIFMSNLMASKHNLVEIQPNFIKLINVEYNCKSILYIMLIPMQRLLMGIK